VARVLACDPGDADPDAIRDDNDGNLARVLPPGE